MEAPYTITGRTRRGGSFVATETTMDGMRAIIRRCYRDRRECTARSVDFDGNEYIAGQVWKDNGWKWFSE